MGLRDEVFRAAGVAAATALLASCAQDGAPKRLAVSAPRVTVACEDFSFPIYFERGSDQLTATARGVIAEAGQRVRGCVLGPLDVLGLADADGTRQRSLEVSQRRAQVVADALKRSGLPAPRFDIDAVGNAGAKVSRGRREPLRRRTEVVIRASRPAAPAANPVASRS